jgi:glycosyltransferase involved in cell wall biosynthesis
VALVTANQAPSAWGIHDAQGPDNPRPSGCGLPGYYRILLPFRQLAANGWQARCQAGTPPPADVADYKIIVGERLDRGEAQGFWRRWRATHRLVYELDDDVYNVNPENWSAYRVYGRAVIQDTVTHLAEVADLITVSTEPLAEVMRQHTGNPNIAVLPNCIPAAMLDMTRPRRKHPVIGWTGGASHSFDVQIIAPTVREFLRKNRDWRLHIVGTDYRATFAVPEDQMRFTPWESDPADYYQHLDFDIGLVPLTGSVFDRSKSAVKAMELGALGIPVICSDVEAYRGYVVDGVSGFLARRPQSWAERLKELAADRALRESMGAKARDQARHHTIEGNWQRWAAAYAPLL